MGEGSQRNSIRKGDRDSWANPDPAFTSRRGFLAPASSPFSYNEQFSEQGDSEPQTALFYLLVLWLGHNQNSVG